ncbi:MAG TPA: patatin-like phospholipase family protein, partial [Phnomibacter sp.]|nr:patatin-like phospholipase family protein [Phnomibacter sp.]
MKKLLLITISLSFLLENGLAQSGQKIGLTLSGGGAKGLAHIGLLKAIDSAGLKIDLVTGTSMGSIVGGLYAAGYTADSIEKIARSIDWKLLLSNNVSMRSYTMEEKSEYGKYAVELSATKGKLSLPTGFLESQELWLKLQELFFPVATVRHFDALPRPFRCIGTDLATGEAVVLKDGDIVSAIRASMAIPGVFSAVDRNGRRLVDGGVVRNFPVKDAIDMGATYTIGISVSTPLKDVKDLDNAVKVLTQVVFLNEDKDRKLESKLVDMLIDIPMGDYTTASFNRSNEIIDLGIDIGRQYYPFFKKLADSLGHHVRENDPAKNVILTSEKHIDKITVTGLRPGIVGSFFEQLNLPVPGTYTADDITEAIRNAFAYRMYKKITYTLDGDGATGYNMICQSEPESQVSFKAAVNYNTLMGISVVGNLTLRNYLTPSSRSLVSVNIGDNFRALAEHLQLFGYRRPWSNRTQFYAEHQDLPFYNANFKQAGSYKANYYRIDDQFLNSSHRRWSAGLGARWEYVDLKPTIQTGDIFEGNSRFFTLYGVMNYNSFERPFFPAKGHKIDLMAGYVLGIRPDLDIYLNGIKLGNVDELGIGYGNYFRITMDYRKVEPLSKKWAGIIDLRSGINFGPNQSMGNNFLLGGINNVVRNQVPF